jgi:hypothetical protein
LKVLIGISDEDFNTCESPCDFSFQQTVQSVVGLSTVDDVSLSFSSFISPAVGAMSEIRHTERILQDSELNVTSATIRYIITIAIDDNNIIFEDDLVTNTTNNLRLSVESGLFENLLQNYSYSYGVNDLLGDVEAGEFRFITYSLSFTRSRSPTLAPGAVSKSGSSSNNFYEDMPTVGQVLFPFGCIVVGILLIAIIIYSHRYYVDTQKASNYIADDNE